MNKYGSSAEVVANFKKGFGKNRCDWHHDMNNAAYLATKLLSLELPYEFRRKGLFGMVSGELCSIMYVTEITEDGDEKTQRIGSSLSDYNSRQLRNMALYLCNSNLLEPDGRGEAENLLKTIPDASGKAALLIKEQKEKCARKLNL